MDREVSQIAEIGVTLLAISIVLGIIFYTVQVGDEIKSDSYSTINRLKVVMTEGALRRMVGVDNDIPTAAALNILKIYGSLIPKAECRIQGCGKVKDLTVDMSCLTSHLKGRVNLEVREVETGVYNVIIHKHDCKWKSGICTCS